MTCLWIYTHSVAEWVYNSVVREKDNVVASHYFPHRQRVAHLTHPLSMSQTLFVVTSLRYRHYVACQYIGGIL